MTVGNVNINNIINDNEVMVIYEDFYPQQEAFGASILERFDGTPLSAEKYDLSATSVGEYALFGGGRRGATYGTAIVDVYTYASNERSFDISMPIGSIYNFSDIEVVSTTNMISVPIPINGYIKYKSGIIK